MYILTLKVNRDRLYLVQEESDSIPTGTNEPVTLYFDLSPEWKNAAVVVGFYNAERECSPQVLMEDSYCKVPPEATTGYWFRLQVLGRTKDGVIQTNKLTILQNGG